MSIELDKRILNKNCIFNCFDIDNAKQYIGKQGYFANTLHYFTNLKNCTKEVLTSITEDPIGGSYYAKEYYEYFLPEDFTKVEKPKKPKYVPFDTTHDLAKVNFHLGNIINFSSKKFPGIIHRAVITEVNYKEVEISYDEVEEKLIDITLGSTTYSFKALFDGYLYLDENEVWTPFGKKV